MSQYRKRLSTIWKWARFSAWFLWFLLSFPWQIQKAYSQFKNATDFSYRKVGGNGKSESWAISGYENSYAPGENLAPEEYRARRN
jgi:hypothetical protein